MIVTLGKTSTKRLNTCIPPLQEIFRTAAADPACPCDFGIACGFRGKIKQTIAFVGKNSKAKWGESDHNVMIGDKPYSMGVDAPPYDPKMNNYVWDKDDPRHEALSKHILYTAKRLGYKLEWGGNYKSIVDKPHYSFIF